MCCVVFLEVLFFLQTEDNISYDNKQNRTTANTASHSCHVFPALWMSKHKHASLTRYPWHWSDPAPLNQRSSWEETGVSEQWACETTKYVNLCTFVSHCTSHHVSRRASGRQLIQHLELKAAVQFIVDVLYFFIVLNLLVFIRHIRAGDTSGHKNGCLRWTQVFWCDDNVR